MIALEPAFFKSRISIIFKDAAGVFKNKRSCRKGLAESKTGNVTCMGRFSKTSYSLHIAGNVQFDHSPYYSFAWRIIGK